MHSQQIYSVFFVALLSLGSTEPSFASSNSAILAPRAHARDVQPLKQEFLISARTEPAGSVQYQSDASGHSHSHSEGSSQWSVSTSGSAKQAGMNRVKVATGMNVRAVAINGCTAIFLFSPSTNQIVGAHADDRSIERIIEKSHEDAVNAKIKVEHIVVRAPDQGDFNKARDALHRFYPNLQVYGGTYAYNLENAKAGPKMSPVWSFTATMDGYNVEEAMELQETKEE